MTPQALLDRWLARALPAEAQQWLQASVERLRRDQRDADLYMAFSLATRKVGKQPLHLAAQDLADADLARPSWHPEGLTTDQAARLYLLLASQPDAAAFERRLTQLCVTADASESVVLYLGLPLYPEPERYRLRAAEGIRTNMKTVFEAIAHRNPYPAEQLPEVAWNQMVLKSLFIGSALDPIIGLDQRANPHLAQMLCDYAHERWAAGRPINPELWRCVGPFAAGTAIDDLRRLLESGTRAEQGAAVLALRASTAPEAAALAKRHPELMAAIDDGSLNWSALAANA